MDRRAHHCEYAISPHEICAVCARSHRRQESGLAMSWHSSDGNLKNVAAGNHMPVTTEYESLRNNINERFADLSDAQMERLMERYGVDAEAAEGFFDDLGKFSSNAGK